MERRRGIRPSLRPLPPLQRARTRRLIGTVNAQTNGEEAWQHVAHVSKIPGGRLTFPPPGLEDDPVSDAPTRGEMSARLEAAEARTEARFAQLSGTLDVRFAHLDHKIDQMTESVARLAAVVQEVKADNKTTRLTIVVTVVASVLAGLAAIWITQGDLLAAFQASITIKPPPAQTAAPK